MAPKGPDGITVGKYATSIEKNSRMDHAEDSNNADHPNNSAWAEDHVLDYILYVVFTTI